MAGSGHKAAQHEKTSLIGEPANSLQRQGKGVTGFVPYFFLFFFFKQKHNSCNWRIGLGDPCGFDESPLII